MSPDSNYALFGQPAAKGWCQALVRESGDTIDARSSRATIQGSGVNDRG